MGNANAVGSITKSERSLPQAEFIGVGLRAVIQLDAMTAMLAWQGDGRISAWAPGRHRLAKESNAAPGDSC
jgi:hypothetical protein